MIVIVQDNKVVATATDAYNGPEQFMVAPEDFDISRAFEYIVVDGQLVLPWVAINKNQAVTLLQETDWAATVDITNPEYSNPYLTNQNEFLAYRSAVRQIAVNPPTTEAVFPIQPKAIWSN